MVFTQRDYRERLYSSAAYLTFLLFATSTVLFHGVSCTREPSSVVPPRTD